MINQIIEKLTAKNKLFNHNFQMFTIYPIDNHYYEVVKGGLDFALGAEVITEGEYTAISNYIIDKHYYSAAQR